MNLVIISIKFLTVTARTKDLLQGNLTRGQFYIKGEAKGHGKKKKEKKTKPTQPNKKPPEQTKKDLLDAHSRFFRDMQVADLFTLSIVSDWRNEEQQRINDAAYISSNF